jgi:glc operon protein GlcG
MTLSLTDARGLADLAIARARSQRLRIAVAVLNELGELVQLDRMDGAAPMQCDVAEAKARTALNFQKPTADLAREFDLHPERRAMYEKVARFTPVPLPGGRPILHQGAVAGAIGVSGSDDQDDEIARAALG